MHFSIFDRFKTEHADTTKVSGNDSQAIPADDPVSRRFSDWMGQFHSLGGELQLLNGSTEDEFLAIGAQLHDFHARAGEIERMSRSVVEQIFGEDVSRDIESLSGILDKINGYLSHAEGESEKSTETLQAILSLTTEVDGPIDGFKKTIKNLHMLSTAVKIESARLGEGAAGFNNLADDVERLSVLIKAKSASILHETATLEGMIASTLTRATDFEADQRKRALSIIEKTRESLATLTDIHNRCSGAAALIADCSTEISGNIADVVMSLQFHDITRQQIEHVKEALDDIRGRGALPADGAERSRFLCEIGDICELQSAQLTNAREEFAGAIDRVVDGLRTVAAKEMQMSGETRSMTGIADGAGHSFFKEMEAGMEMVAAVLAESADANRSLAEAMHSVIGSVGEISNFVNDIEEIGSEIELIALNSQVKAANTGDGGAALGVLAEAIQHLSVDARARTRTVTDMLREVTGVTERLELGLDTEVRNVADEVEGLVGELKNLLNSVRGSNEALLGFLSGMDDSVRRLSGDIEHATQGITVQGMADRVIQGVIAALDGVVRDIRLVVPETGMSNKAQRLRELSERYTMHSERRVHDAVTASGKGKGSVPVTSTADADLGDNFELF